MAQEYHGDGDVCGLLHKIGNVGITHVNEQKIVTQGGKQKAPEVTKVRGRMTQW
jgi:hypothetical protein